MPKRINAEQRKDWRNLPLADWNTLTCHTMIIEMNAEKFGVEKYVPMRGWQFEQGVLKRSLAEYGAPALRETIERAFAEHHITPKYPQLTAGFIVAYMLPRIMPQVLANGQRKERVKAAQEQAIVNGGMTAEELAEFL
ncbi:hypothetical protein MHB77_32535 [Paenibacillus sp. FSL K6-3166]|uniref:hypothetical protein n=1 Tax=unclassified Paenibacillus TaxID=185978 RepID=UPI000BA05673|nr:hypothetical protein [Paenibacillus sp. VTT E-133291]OZQ84673.1 hypothetical protein CA598_23040 [Paenibacillus sp. VTT E-133291]